MIHKYSIMKRLFNTKSLIFFLAIMTAACSSHRYTVEKADFRRYTIDSSYDNLPNAEAEKFIAPYRQTVDSIMSPIVGYAAYAMEAGRPESLLSNFLTDILVAAGGDFNEKPDLGIYNIGGIRASISKGPIRAGDIIDVAPFENKLCFLTLTGKDLISLFEQIAARGGEGVSSQVRAVISKDGRLRSLSIKGEPVREEATYRIATIDYLAEGNDGMPAFTLGTDRKMLSDKSNNLRYIIISHLQHLMKQGKMAESSLEGRITIE